MQSSCLMEVRQVCLHSCCPSPLLGIPELQDKNPKPRSTSAACRCSFAATTASSFFPNTQFTDHESLPSLPESYSQFMKAYPQYSETAYADQIRAQEYYHLALSNHICLDYIGICLFSGLQVQSHDSSIIPIASSSSPKPQSSDIPFFGTSFKSFNLKSQLLHGGQGSELESAIKKRIMCFLNISEQDYYMVFTANRSSAFKLVAESYPFKSSRKLLTVYDYESEAVEAMINTSEKRGASVMSAEFKWPTLRIQSSKLRNLIIRKRKKKRSRGLFVFPIQSRMTGASYSYQWMSMAQENGWHVLLDACALVPKDMDSFGLSLFRPDFLVCSFYKVFGQNPTGFGCLFVRKSTAPILDACIGTGIVSLVPAKKLSQIVEESSDTDTELEQASRFVGQGVELGRHSSVSGSVITQHVQHELFDQGQASKLSKSDVTSKEKRSKISEEKSEKPIDFIQETSTRSSRSRGIEIECRGLDHVDSMGLTLISSRARCLINWLVNSLMKLKHPNTESDIPLVRIYGPKVKFNRRPALAFNVYDWKSEKVKPVLVQKLADRCNISLGQGFLHRISFADKYKEDKERVTERRKDQDKGMMGNESRKADQGITVVTAALGFLANFEDVHRLWAFVARFLDADFVEKERWRYTALNQKTVEV